MELLRRFVVGLTLLASGCGFVREPTPLAFSGEQIVVHSLLHAGTDTVTVLVQRMSLTHGSPAPTIRPVSGADVRITGGGGELRLREAAGGFRRCGPLDVQGADPNRAEAGCYAAVLPGGVGAGRRYELKIALAGGGTIQGVVVIPEVPTILAPSAHARFVLGRRGTDGYDYVGEVPVRWRVDEQGGDLQLSVRADALFREGKIAQGGPCDTRLIESSGQYIGSQRADSALIRFVLLGCSLQPGQPVVHDSIRGMLLLTSFDTAYTRYRKLGGLNETVREQEASAGISGALGVFAGAATAERPITLIQAP